MRQQDRVDRRGVVGERNPVADRLVRAALEHPAVDEDPGAGGLEQELGAGDRRGGAQELEVHPRMVPSAAARRRATVGSRPLRLRYDPAMRDRWFSRRGRGGCRCCSFGLVIFGIGIGLMAQAGLGLSPWEVFHQGISRRTGYPARDRLDPAGRADPAGVVAARRAPGHRDRAEHRADRRSRRTSRSRPCPRRPSSRRSWR